MLTKGFWSANEYVSSQLIVHKFRKLQAEVNNKTRPDDILVSFLQECANRDLLLFLEAIPNDLQLASLCGSTTMSDFWDGMLKSPVVGDMLTRICHASPTFDCLGPQSSVSSYYLIQGAFYYGLALLAKSQQKKQNTVRELHYLDLAMQYGNFQALVARAHYLNLQLNVLIRDQQPLDPDFVLQTLTKLNMTADKYGAAGFLVVAKVFLRLSKYYGQALEDSKKYYYYFFAAYTCYLKAMMLSTMHTDDVHNALLGHSLESLLPVEFLSILEAVRSCRGLLSECGVSEKYLLGIEKRAEKEVLNYHLKYYLEHSVNRGNNLLVD